MLNEFGLRVWSHRTKSLTANRYYKWVDNITIVAEGDDGHRRVINCVPFSTFDFSDWIEWSKEDYKNELNRLYSLLFTPTRHHGYNVDKPL